MSLRLSLPASMRPYPSAATEVRRLREAIERYQAARARRAGWERRFGPTGLAALDARLPHGGLPCGAITEILAEAPGVGAMSLAMRIASRLSILDSRLSMGADSSSMSDLLRPCVSEPVPAAPGSLRPLVMIDSNGDFYPPAAGRYGIDFEQLIVVRPRNERDAYWAMDQALRCPAVAAVIAPLETLNDQLARRLQLAAESSGCVGVVLRTGSRPTHRFAAVRMRVEGLPIADCQLPNRIAADFERQLAIGNWQFVCRITLLTVREGSPAEPFLVDLDHETGAGFVSAVPVDRTARRIAN